MDTYNHKFLHMVVYLLLNSPKRVAFHTWLTYSSCCFSGTHSHISHTAISAPRRHVHNFLYVSTSDWSQVLRFKLSKMEQYGKKTHASKRQQDGSTVRSIDWHSDCLNTTLLHPSQITTPVRHFRSYLSRNSQSSVTTLL